jgi:hypothetical protein
MTGQPTVPPGGDPASPISESSPEESGQIAGGPVDAPAQLEPGRGAPLVPGPPKSVSDPINAGTINRVFGIGGLLGILVIIIVVILVGLLLISVLSHR